MKISGFILLTGSNLRGAYTGKSDFKKIDDSVDKPYYDRMHARLQSVNREKIRQIPGSTVEPVLGTLVNYPGMRQINACGIKHASKCMLMAAVAYNLKKLLKWEQIKVQSVQMTMEKVKTSLHHLFFVIRLFMQRSVLLIPAKS